MKELLRTADIVRASFLQSLLAEAGIESLLLDANTSALLPALIEQRLMLVDDADAGRARSVLRDAGEAFGA